MAWADSPKWEATAQQMLIVNGLGCNITCNTPATCNTPHWWHRPPACRSGRPARCSLLTLQFSRRPNGTGQRPVPPRESNSIAVNPSGSSHLDFFCESQCKSVATRPPELPPMGRPLVKAEARRLPETTVPLNWMAKHVTSMQSVPWPACGAVERFKK